MRKCSVLCGSRPRRIVRFESLRIADSSFGEPEISLDGNLDVDPQREGRVSPTAEKILKRGRGVSKVARHIDGAMSNARFSRELVALDSILAFVRCLKRHEGCTVTPARVI